MGEDQSEASGGTLKTESKSESAPDTHDSGESESYLHTTRKVVGSAIKTGFKAVGAVLKSGVKAASSIIGRENRHALYEKKISIDLPHGKGPKTYCHWISYKPTNCKLSPDPVITLTIKPSGRCYHEDTHLFARFAGYNYTLN